MSAGWVVVIVAPRRFEDGCSGCGRMDEMGDLLMGNMYGAR